jgi:hypothetical protein
MPVGYLIDEAHEIVLSRGWGVVADPDLLLHARTLSRDARFAPHYHQLTDARDVSRLDVTAAGVETLANVVPFGAGARRAIVAGSDAAFGMARMFEMLRGTKEDEIFVFRDMDAALRWLGLTESSAEILAKLSQVPPIAVPP